jgi:hypothetical protein
MQRKLCALALGGALVFAATAAAHTPSFFEQWAYPWGPWTPDTPHVWGNIPPYQPRPYAYQPGVGRFLERPICRGILEVHLPDPNGLLYVNGNPEPLRGPVHVLRTEILKGGPAEVFVLRAAFRSGGELLIEDRTVAAGRGERIPVTFDGTNAIRVKLPHPGPGAEELPPPRQLPGEMK